MRRRVVLGGIGLTCLLAALAAHDGSARAQKKDEPAPKVQWIWFDEGDPLQSAPVATRYFRRVFTLDKPADEAALEITADNAYTVWVNGAEVGRGNEWKDVQKYDVKKHLVAGKNVVAVEARNDGGPAGLLVRLGAGPKGQSRVLLVSDGSWKSATEADKDWRKLDFDDSKWRAAKALGAYGEVGPWRDLVWGGAPVARRPGRFTVPEGFKVEQAVEPPENDRNFSLVNMTFDAKGRLLVSREGGPTLLCTEPDEKGVCRKVRPYCDLVKNSQGMCCVGDALLLVGDGPQGTGLYRCRDTKGADKVDEVKLLHKFNGGMGEHGPHAVLLGPDGWLYLVIGNHAHAKVDRLAANSPLTRWPTGAQGPDQGQPGSTEDVLLPRLNDANGHAANIRAPGGTIWRLDQEGKNMALVSAGFRNHFDAAFSPAGELFTFDSDMEWDEGLPWYRHVRVSHCPPGADFVWRTGAANTPNYYLDSLPPLYETGRGSPVGLEFYDHHLFGPEYRGCYFMADWSIGVIWAVHLERAGATYRAKKVEKFCQGSPMNVTDLNVGRDGALYFVMGGRGSQGGVYRIVRTDGAGKAPDLPEKPDEKSLGRHLVEMIEQPLSAWSRWEFREASKGVAPATAIETIFKVASDAETPTPLRLRALTLLHIGFEASLLDKVLDFDKDLVKLAKDRNADVRAHAAWLLGVRGYQSGKDVLLAALKDDDALVRRRACEALIRVAVEPKVDDVWPLLGDKDQFVRTAARLVLQRIDPKKWADRIPGEKTDLVAWEAIVALCKLGKLPPEAGVFARLDREPPADADALVGYLRTLQLALFHSATSETETAEIAKRCLGLFPQKDWRVNRELAILLTHFHKEKVLTEPPQPKLMAALKASAGDRPQQIHYFYCMRLLKDGWTPEQKADLFAWFDGTRDWTGGASFKGFLENILRDLSRAFTKDDVAALVAHGEKYPRATAVMLKVTADAQQPLAAALGELYARLAKEKANTHLNDLKTTIIARLGKNATPELQGALRTIADSDPAQRDAVARTLSAFPSAENYPYLLHGLNSANKLVVFDCVEALKKTPTKPKADDAAPYRAALLAARKLDEGNRWKAVQLLRHWSNDRRFGGEDGAWKGELNNWGRWFAQSFPKEPPLPDVSGVAEAESKHKFDELLAYLEKEGKTGDVKKGRVVFEKAQCLKCHKYGTEGDAVGPDLTNLSKRFKRADVLESILFPSKVISDQYRSTRIVTKKGQDFLGLASAPQDGVLTLLQQDGTKVTLKESEIEQKFASLVSVMPERLLDPLDRKEIADLFAFLESEPAK